MVLAQEDKFDIFNQLADLINEHQRITGEIAPITLPDATAPRGSELTSAPASPSSILRGPASGTSAGCTPARVHKKMSNIQELVRKMNDILHNRIDSNLKEAARVMLVSLPEDQSATPDEFLAMQNRVVKDEGAALMIEVRSEVRAARATISLSSSPRKCLPTSGVSPSNLTRTPSASSRDTLRD